MSVGRLREYFFEPENVDSRLNGIAPVHRELNLALLNAMREFEFLQRHREHLLFPGGVLVEGFAEWTIFKLVFPHSEQKHSLEVSVYCRNGGEPGCEVDVTWGMPGDDGTWSASDRCFTVYAFCSKNNVEFDNRIDVGADHSQRLAAILCRASHILLNQCEFCCFDHSWLWLRGDILRGPNANSLVEGVLRNEFLNCLDYDNSTILTRVISAGQWELMEKLLASGAQLTSRDLSEAMQQCYENRLPVQPVVDRLVEAGAELDGRSAGLTPLGVAALYNDVHLVGHLLRLGAKRVSPTQKAAERSAVHAVLQSALGPYWMG